MHSDATNFENDESMTGFSVSIFKKDGKISVTIKRRIHPGAPLEVKSNDDVSDIQLSSICKLLDKYL